MFLSFHFFEFSLLIFFSMLDSLLIFVFLIVDWGTSKKSGHWQISFCSGEISSQQSDSLAARLTYTSSGGADILNFKKKKSGSFRVATSERCPVASPDSSPHYNHHKWRESPDIEFLRELLLIYISGL